MSEVRLEDLKGNSNKGRKQPERKEETRVRKVANGQVVKKSAGKKFMDTFIKEDAKNIRDYVIGDVLIPTIVDTFIDICESTIEMLFRGERRDYRRSSSSSRTKEKASYQAYYQSDRNKDRKVYEASGNSSYPVKDIKVFSKADAEEIYGVLGDLLRDYDHISVRDLYDCAGISSSSFTDNNWGWTSMVGFSTKRIGREEYLLVVPRPESI